MLTTVLSKTSTTTVGVLLVDRGVLFVFFASFFAVESNVILMLVIVSSIVLLAFSGNLYKVLCLNLLESSFFVNLGVLATGTLYIRLVGGSQETLVATSAGIAFLQFVGIVTFHVYEFVIVPIGNHFKSLETIIQNLDQHVELEALQIFNSFDSDSEDDVRPKPVVTHSEVCVEVLRKEAEEQLQQQMELGTEETPPGNKGIEPTNHQIPCLKQVKHASTRT